MKLAHALFITTGIVIALITGWFYDGEKLQHDSNPLVIPDNIDYYLSKVKIRSMNSEGTLHYQLNTPYLEHYIKQDSSQITKPHIKYISKGDHWVIDAATASLAHRTEIFELKDQVVLNQKSPSDTVSINTSLMVLDPLQDRINIPKPLTLKSNKMNLKASMATLDTENKLYQFSRVRAVYSSKQGNEQHAG